MLIIITISFRIRFDDLRYHLQPTPEHTYLAYTVFRFPETKENKKADDTPMADETTPPSLGLTLQLPQSPPPLSRPMTPRSPVAKSGIGWRPVEPGYTAPVVISRTVQVSRTRLFGECRLHQSFNQLCYCQMRNTEKSAHWMLPRKVEMVFD